METDIPKFDFNRYIESDQQLTSMFNFCREARRNHCDIDLSKEPSKDIRLRYGLSSDDRRAMFAWWLLEEYSKGNLIYKEDVQSESGGETHS